MAEPQALTADAPAAVPLDDRPHPEAAAPRPATARQLWPAYVVVFLASACTLVIELIAGRMMAPFVGVSLYTWTSIIGVVLAGVSGGNYLGGLVADRFPQRRTLGVILLASALASLSILGTIPLLEKPEIFRQAHLMVKIVGFATLIFFLPSCVLGMVSPVVVKLALSSLDVAGNTVGKIYAFSALGSIFGTFLTGFVLIAWMGTRLIVLLVTVVLALLAVAFGDLWRRPLTTAAALLALIALTTVADARGALTSPCYKETNYYCIKVQDTTLDDGTPARSLILDHLIHSYTVHGHPETLGYAYEKVYAEVVNFLVESGKGTRISALFLGGGGYTFPRYLLNRYPESQQRVVEIDPGVTATNYEQLELPRDTPIKTFNLDARLFLMQGGNAGERYDFVFGDAFNDLSIPYHLTTVEFDHSVQARLKDDGYYLANIIDDYKDGQFLRAYVRTLQQVFPHVYLMAPGNSWRYFTQQTFVVVAGNRPLDLEGFRAWGGGRQLTSWLSQQDLDEYLAGGRAIVLTDDYVPADNLIAPVFAQRGY